MTNVKKWAKCVIASAFFIFLSSCLGSGPHLRVNQFGKVINYNK